ncbi:MAG: TrpR YerC/YecD [Clostridia bacterium]|nr:TrpR YerC/YecD [Clostridia bacterium]
MDHIHADAASRLFRAILTLRTEEECRSFFDDLCTIKELQDLTQRLEVASMLSEGKNYQEVSRATGASTATICRVNKCLNYGSRGYVTALNRMKENEDKS